MIEEILRTAREIQTKQWGTGRQLRGAHAKAHGFAWGKFEVLEVPESLRAGLFATPGEYEVCIRTSSTPNTIESDEDPAVCGLALKVLGVPGTKLIPDGPRGDAQDFLLVTASHVGFGTIAGFRDLIVKQSEDRTYAWFLGRKGLFNAVITAESLSRPKQVLGLQFWSAVPYRCGREVVKYCVKAPKRALELPRARNSLRAATAKQLREEPFTLDFFVQVQTDPERQPVEDSSVEWDERDSPLIQVARVHLPVQDLDAPGRDAYAEGLRFNPWHALLEHRPLGGLNRTRAVVYHSMSQERLASASVAPYEAVVGASDLSPTALPQHDRAPDARAELLSEMRELYQPDPNKLAPLVMCRGVPAPSVPAMEWIGIAGEIGGRILLNALDNKISRHPAAKPSGVLAEGESKLRHAVEGFAKDVVTRGTSTLKQDLEQHVERDRNAGADDDDLRERVDSHVHAILGGSIGPALEVFEDNKQVYLYRKPQAWPQASGLADYEALYQSLPVPPAAKTIADDDDFAWRRIAGPNPGFLRRVSSLPDNFPVTDALLRAATGPGDSLRAAIEQGRLYLADYAALERVLEPGLDKGIEMHFYAPIGLFAVRPDDQRLVPVAVQCGQDPSRFSLVSPRDGWDWAIAKTVLEIADLNYFEPITHLALTHLMIEPVALATHRTLAPNHPVSRLLLPHFEGTISVNDNAVNHLLADNGAIDQTFAASMPSIRAAAASAISTHDFRRETLAQTLADAGLDDRSALPIHPWRDDSLRIWGAINRWVRSYVDRAYPSETDLAEDFELVAWTAALDRKPTEGGLNGFGNIRSRVDLVEVLTKIVYTASAGHAAVNFPQWTDAGFAARMSGAGYSAVPGRGASEADYLALLPPLEKAELHGEFLFLLGTLYYTRLGAYQPNPSTGAPAFDDPVVVNELLPTFVRELEQIEAAITADNRERRPRPYEHLLPSKIPQSINV